MYDFENSSCHPKDEFSSTEKCENNHFLLYTITSSIKNLCKQDKSTICIELVRSKKHGMGLTFETAEKKNPLKSLRKNDED